MTSTFMGLETAKRGMFTQQSALYTTGHNISNANTPGYSRQRVNFQTTTPYPAVGLNRPDIPGQMGTGVEAGSVQRIRDGFLDVQYQNENTKLGYWSARADALTKVEDIINEPTDEGLAATMTELWKSFQDLAGASENEGARGVVLERLQAAADTFNYLSDSLHSVKQDFGNQAGITVNAANSVIEKLFTVNQQISEIEPNGYLPNDLYDERDRLVDELSQYMNVSIAKEPSGGNAVAIAEGIYTVSIMDSSGAKINVIDKESYSLLSFANSTSVDTSIPVGSNRVDNFYLIEHDRANTPGAIIEVPFADANGSPVFPNGEIKGLIEAYGYKGMKDTDGDGTVEAATVGIYQNMIDELDKFAYTFKTLVNDIHKMGFDAEGNPGQDMFLTNAAAAGEPVYTGAASSLSLTGITTKQVAASAVGPDGTVVNIGDGNNALNLSSIGAMLLKPGSTIDLLGTGTDYTIPADLPIKTGSMNSFYEGVIGRLGVDSQQASRMESNVEVLRASVVTNRESVSSVSLDEEMTNLIKYQHAYNGAARMITIVDEMLDKIINGMGTGGR
ncbi:flagellar hook-associated protein FlgK [Domibacillus sp. A3M-37]|uniref:flagellar hook-associated protein FlgK n=1 Tax=Domibacillus sp. A3M-37 TaxID=2962037 RepID=UPI0020B88374|nr:flagellar hook-associated protein FlgK [Domibacillus sp. A3M-37]MCP3761235.1 flagellar hook-associated protein FlgK [Domibacillus sp. A3M-37]